MNLALLIGRVLIAQLFLLSAHAALGDIAGTTAYFTGLGLPLPSVAAIGTGLFELAGGLLLVAGLFTRPTALALAAFSFTASLVGHLGQGEGSMAFWHMQMLMKDIAVAGGLLGFAVYGAGAISIDARRNP